MHTDSEAISALALGLLEETEGRSVRAHCESCSDCGDQLAGALALARARSARRGGGRVRMFPIGAAAASLLIVVSLLGGLMVAVEHSRTASQSGASVQQIVEVGCASCPGSNENLAPVDLAMQGDRIWVLDGFEPFARSFDAAGRRIAAFVLEGEGPAETGTPFGIHYDASGKIVIHSSLPPSLLTVDSAHGSHLARVELPLRVPLSADYHAPTGTLYLLSFVFGENGARLDRVDVPTGDFVTILTVEADTAPDGREEPLETRVRHPIAALRSGGFVIGNVWDYRLQIRSDQGQLVRDFGISAEVLPSVEGGERQHFDRYGIRVDATTGLIWVRMLRGDTAAETAFDIWDETGSFRGSVVVPSPSDRSFRSFAVDANRVALIRETSDGTNILSVWRVSWDEQRQGGHQ